MGHSGIIFDIKRFAVHDGPGIRVTAFLKGCALCCKWCHNPEALSPDICKSEKHLRIENKVFIDTEDIGYEITPEDLIKEFAKERVFMDESGGGVTFSGGEPLLQIEFLAETLALCKQRGFHTAIDTSGYAMRASFEKIAPLTDLFLYDLKIIDDAHHIEYTGVSNRKIHENLKFLVEIGKKIQIRMPMIPEATMNEVNICRSIEFLRGIKGKIEGIDLLPFHNTAKHKYTRFRIDNRFADTQTVAKDELNEIKQQFENEGFKVKIGG